MLDPFADILERYITIPESEGPNKVTTLPEAVSRLVEPGMILHLCSSHNRPGAATLELVRQFAGKQPDFTISALGVVSTTVALVHTGMTRKIITTFAGDSYPTPGPNPVIQRAFMEARLEIENWSILTFSMRLMAGALNIPFIPTQSIIGSGMAYENDRWIAEAEDEQGNIIGILRAFQPDLAFVHAAAADPEGNLIMTPPYGEGPYGALAAKKGVIATVDRIVSSDFVRRYSHLCKVPAYKVEAVCEMPMGAHPGGLSNRGLPEIESYADDYDFIQDFREVCKSDQDLDRWIKDWITDTPTWEAYLERLGQKRIWHLKGKAHQDSWKSELLTRSCEISDKPEYSTKEMMVVAAGRTLAKKIKDHQYKTILAGVGVSNLSAWLAYFMLKQEGYDCELMAEIGFYGYAPRPADPFIFNYRNMPTCKMLSDINTIMGVFMGGRGTKCIGSIGAAQVDCKGNVNSTKIPGKAYFVGSGGANDICSSAREVVVTALQGKERFLKQVDYITSPGLRVLTVVSDLGILEKISIDGELGLAGYYPQPDKSEAQIIQQIKDNCGWDVRARGHLDVIEPPTLDELKLLRICDPQGQFLGK